ncbi:MAG: alpha/beta fold hydrolase [Acidobacteriota bacterium]
MLRRVDLPPFSLWEWREGEGTPLVLIHGLSGSLRWWKQNVPELAKRHTVAAIDLVGFGRNRRFTASSVLPAFDDISALLARWIEASFEDRVHLVGHSMGGQIAIHLAATRPDLLRSLILVNSTGIPFSFRPAPHLRQLSHPPHKAWSFATVLARDFFRAGPISVAVGAARLFIDDARPAMRKVRTPTLLLWGDHDALVPDTYAREIQKEIEGSKLIVLPGGSHIPMWATPEEFNAAVLDCIAQVENSGTRGQDIPATVGGFGWGVAGCERGIFYRRSGDRPAIVLVHGLGMSSAYFAPLARELFERGMVAVAPDLRGFGHSSDAPALTPGQHAERLVRWARDIGLEHALWMGHSTGCDIVSEVAVAAPDLVSRAIHLAPIWNDYGHPWLRLALRLLRDAGREPPALIPLVIRDYWRTGLLRWFGTLRRHLVVDFEATPRSEDALCLIGSEDPLMDVPYLSRIFAEVVVVKGTHALNFSNPSGVADAVQTKMLRRN